MNLKSTTWKPFERAAERCADEERSVEGSRADEFVVVVALLAFMVLFFYTVFVS